MRCVRPNVSKLEIDVVFCVLFFQSRILQIKDVTAVNFVPKNVPIILVFAVV